MSKKKIPASAPVKAKPAPLSPKLRGSLSKLPPMSKSDRANFKAALKMDGGFVNLVGPDSDQVFLAKNFKTLEEEDLVVVNGRQGGVVGTRTKKGVKYASVDFGDYNEEFGAKGYEFPLIPAVIRRAGVTLAEHKGVTLRIYASKAEFKAGVLIEAAAALEESIASVETLAGSLAAKIGVKCKNGHTFGQPIRGAYHKGEQIACIQIDKIMGVRAYEVGNENVPLGLLTNETLLKIAKNLS